MRVGRRGAVLAITLLLAATGCGRMVNGAARTDPHEPGTAITGDGFGIITGRPDAKAQIEVYTEPQCSHCAHLQGQYGPTLRTLINIGDLAVTYRPVTFLDQGQSTYSARVTNALFIAAGHGTSGPAFQSFVEDVWGHQQPYGTGPTDAELSDMAGESHVSGEAVALIKAAQPAVRTDDMTTANVARLQSILRASAATPTVFDLNRNKVVDITKPDWVAKVMSSKMTT